MINFLLKTITLLFVLQTAVWGQQPITYFDKVYGGNDTMNMLTQIVKPLDKGYLIMGGYRTSNYRFFYAAKLDLQGNIKWFKNIDSINTVLNNPLDLGVLTNGSVAIQLNDKSIVATYGKHQDIVVAKIDTNGIVTWRRVYEKENEQIPNQIIQTIDGGYAITGVTANAVQDSSWGYLLKLNYLGNFEWDRLYERGNSVTFFSVQQWWDGTYIMGGWGWNGTDYDMWVVKTDSMGDTLWTKALGGDFMDCGARVSFLTTWEDWYFNGAPVTYLINGCDYLDEDNNYKVYTAKLSEDGDSLYWEQRYSNPQLFYLSPLQTMPIIYPDGSFLGTASYISDGTDFPDEIFRAAVLIKFRANGTVEWYKKFYPQNTFAEAYLKDLQRTPDGGYVMAGYQYSPSPQKGWVIKLDSAFNTCSFSGCDSTIYTGGYPIGIENALPSPINKAFSIVPNPTNGGFNLSIDNFKEQTLFIYDVNGRLINSVPIYNSNTWIDTKQLTTGIYYCKLLLESKVEKLVIIR